MARTQNAAKTTTNTSSGSDVDGPCEAIAPFGIVSCSTTMRSRRLDLVLSICFASSQPMNAFPVLSASAIASSGLPATATRRITGISESSTRFAVTTDVAPMADTEPGSSPNCSRRKSATPSDSMMNGYVLAFRMIVFRSGGWLKGTSCGVLLLGRRIVRTVLVGRGGYR